VCLFMNVDSLNVTFAGQVPEHFSFTKLYEGEPNENLKYSNIVVC